MAVRPSASDGSVQHNREISLHGEMLEYFYDAQKDEFRNDAHVMRDVGRRIIEIEDLAIEFCVAALSGGASEEEVRELITRGAHRRTESGFMERVTTK